ncbi:MAG: 30S ribosomal protein S16 [Acidobacteriota bacterium]|nr:30S ribosomal protein S16 [Acidobacteriota bacterium]MDE3044201.1 30S ribosomal protein S16 [Acidobacteriota bacterium]MDE3222708.1 30S ribosomal protein S16 [Acidobacteriota bacterium]
MAVKLRLVRMGKKKQPTYRVVAAESRRARSGAFLEIVGTYQPRGLSVAEPETVINIDNDKVVAWLRQGAQPTERVSKLLKMSGALDAFAASKSGAVTPAASAPEASAPVAATVHATIDDDGDEAAADDAGES